MRCFLLTSEKVLRGGIGRHGKLGLRFQIDGSGTMSDTCCTGDSAGNGCCSSEACGFESHGRKLRLVLGP